MSRIFRKTDFNAHMLALFLMHPIDLTQTLGFFLAVMIVSVAMLVLEKEL